MKILITLILSAAALFATPNVGDKEIPFVLPGLYQNHMKVSSQELHGKVILLNLWASWCSGCQEEMPLFVNLQNRYSKDKFQIILVNIDSERQNGIDFLRSVDPQQLLSALYDRDKSLPKAYRCPGMPSSFLIDQKGNIAGVYIGSFDKEGLQTLEKQITKLLGK